MNRAARWWMVGVLVMAMSAVFARAADPTAEGKWEGAVLIPGTKLDVIVTLKAGDGGKLSGDISIPAQHAKNLALEKLSASGADVGFSIAGVPGDPTFAGKLSADGATLAGDFTQGGGKFPFELKRAKEGAGGGADAALLDGFDAWLDKTREDWHVPGIAVAIVRHGEVIYVKGDGVRDLDSKAPVTSKTLFAIGSSTKAFTTYVLGTLVDEGKVDFDKPVRAYIPTFAMHDPIASDHMTVRDLVTHRSGLPRHDLMWYNSTLSRAEMVSRLQYLEPNEEFRAKWQYNNLMFLTAGYLVEQVTGKTWEDAVRARVLGPLGMSRTNFSVAESQKSDDFAQPYERRREGEDGTGEYAMRKMPFRDISAIGPAGSINSCVDDMARWVTLQLGDGKFDGKKVIAPNILQELHKPQMVMGGELSKDGVVAVGYAMGWMVDVYRGHLRVHHGGNIDGFSALVTLLPDDDLGVVVLCNMNASPLPGLVNRQAIDRVLKLEPRDWSAEAIAKRDVAEAAGKDAQANEKTMARKPGTKPAHELKEYAAEYENAGYGIIKVTLSDGKLGFEYNRITAPLDHWHYETFVCLKNPADPAFENMKLLFHTGIEGEVDGLEIGLEPMLKPLFFARRGDSQLRDAAYLARFVGGYELSGQIVTVTLSGSTLTAVVTGQAPYELVPEREDTFALKGLSGFRVKFVTEQGGTEVSEAVFMQPNGVFMGKRKR